MKGLYEAHETELLKDRQEPNVEGMDEEQAKEALKKDYEERRNIMDASPIHVAIAGRMMFKTCHGQGFFLQYPGFTGKHPGHMLQEIAIGDRVLRRFQKIGYR